MDLRIELVRRFFDGERMTDLCREYGISRKTGNKFKERFERLGRLFRRVGLPMAIRSDNGVPFASRGLAGLTKLSAYWMRLGIRLERIRPAPPEENGRHERVHRTLKFETAKPPRANLLQQQERFDAFGEEFNEERPHEALGMRTPAKVYKPSVRPYPTTLPDLEYPAHDDVKRVGPSGFIVIPRVGQVYVSQALAGMHVGIDEQSDERWLASFMNLDLGHYDRRTGRLHSIAT